MCNCNNTGNLVQRSSSYMCTPQQST